MLSVVALFVLACILVFGFLFLIWSNKTWYNILFKMIFLALTVWGLFIMGSGVFFAQ